MRTSSFFTVPQAPTLGAASRAGGPRTIHAAVAHVHPFWDGNGRIARLIANLPLLQSGLPPVVIPKERRRQYIQLLAEYELNCGTLTKASGPWPRPDRLAGFTRFVTECYQLTRKLLEA